MLLPAPLGSSRRGARCGCRCGRRRGAARRGSRGSHRAGSRRFPVQLPALFPERLPVPPPAGHPPGAPRERTAEPRRRHGPERSRAPRPRAGSMPRGQAWTQAEVRSLLSLVEGTGEAALLMASTSRPNEELWREISWGLSEAGYERTVAQCRSKWKALKQAFHSERETRRRAGFHSPQLPPHYRAMKVIWKAAGRPVFGDRRLPGVVNLSSRRRRSAPATRPPSSPGTPEHNVGGDTSSTLLSPMLQRVKDEPESSAGGEHVAGLPLTPPAMPHAGCCFSALSLLGFPGETSLGIGRRNQVLPLAAAATGSHETSAMSELPAAGEDASDTSLHGSGMAGLLQNVQQLLVEILQTSRQQQALLESLASDTVSHLHHISHSLVQVGETLYQLLLRPHPGPIGHYVPHMPPFEGGSCSSGAPHTSLDHKEEPQLSRDARCIPP
nr:uncharacterized protein LOC100226145 isoform X1 [Taeniopygia guttata]